MIYKVESLEKLRDIMENGATILATECCAFIEFEVDGERAAIMTAPPFNKGDYIHVPPLRVQLA